jgi:predicted RNA binding protein YcfA (HicA-like mRNA interferase family)
MMSKDFKDVRKEAERQGWKVEQTRGSHWRFIPPDVTKDIVHASGTPSDRRSLDNFIAQLRRSGFRWSSR